MINEPIQSFIIHSRAFGETSMIFDLLTLQNGIISVIIKGAKKRKDSGHLHVAKEFDMYISKAKLPMVVKYEVSHSYLIKKKHLLIILYFNELLLRLVPKSQPQKSLYSFYKKYLAYMTKTEDADNSIVIGFEVLLLKNIGYAISTQLDIHKIRDDKLYSYDHLAGFKEVTQHLPAIHITGKTLKKLLSFDINSITELTNVRLITRNIIKNIAGERTIKSYDII